MPKSTSRKTNRSSRKRRSHVGRRLYRKTVSRRSRTSGSDIYHYHETINGGSLIVPSGTTGGTRVNSGGVWIMRLSDFPIYQRLVNVYEFARINKCTITFIPKFNMQVSSTGASESTHSITGTLITAIDQVPIMANYAGATQLGTAITWENDGSNDANVTYPAPAASTTVDCTYVRGLQSSKEKELYKKQVISFFPAFYTPVLDIGFTNTSTSSIGSNLSATGCFTRQVKKWVTTNLLNQTSTTADAAVATPGPLFYGPVYALDLNDIPDTGSGALQLFDVRFTYSISFKRLKGSITNIV